MKSEAFETVEPAGWPSGEEIKLKLKQRPREWRNGFNHCLKWLKSQAVGPRVERLSDEEVEQAIIPASGGIEGHAMTDADCEWAVRIWRAAETRVISPVVKVPLCDLITVWFNERFGSWSSDGTVAMHETDLVELEARIAKHGVPGQASLSNNELLKTIREWKHHWLQKEPGYEERAFGIDSNMMHHLATLIAKQLGEGK